jgi:ring-1,2-phenylacetyl-CoA epoxidase subunit PaaD
VVSARDVLDRVVDPELPMLTIADLGILRDVREEGGRVEVTVTPTYSGCPALDSIRADVEAALRAAGYSDVTVTVALAPAWTTDEMSDAGRRKLAAAGIAPPAPRAAGPVSVNLAVACPQCGSTDTRVVSRFGSTACKALRACRACAEPFDAFKTL